MSCQGQQMVLSYSTRQRIFQCAQAQRVSVRVRYPRARPRPRDVSNLGRPVRLRRRGRGCPHIQGDDLSWQFAVRTSSASPCVTQCDVEAEDVCGDDLSWQFALCADSVSVCYTVPWLRPATTRTNRTGLQITPGGMYASARALRAFENPRKRIRRFTRRFRVW